MEGHPLPADDSYILDENHSYLYGMQDDPHSVEVAIKPSVGYSQTLDRPYRDPIAGGGTYTVPRNYHFRGPGAEPMQLIPPTQHPGYSSLSRPNQRYRPVEPYRGPGYGPQPQVRGGGFGGSQSDLLAGRGYGSEDAYGMEEDRRSLGGYVDGLDYSTVGRRGANGGDPRMRLRSYEDPLSDRYGSTLPASGSLSSLGPAPVGLAPNSGTWRQPELPEVIAMLSYTLDAVRLNAAAYLQHLSYRNEDVKKEVCRLRGIPPLISLLEDPRPPVRLAACGALKNLSYGPAKENKLAVKNCDGVPALGRLLRRRGDGREMAECVTGTLWNLSSLDSIKMELVDQALNTLTQEILVPHSGWQRDGGLHDEEGKPKNIEWEQALVNTTGCLRNISSERSEARRKMRECEGLVDSVVYILRSEISNKQVDRKLVENVVCLLRNLSYHIHREIPQAEKYQEMPQNSSAEPQNQSCFGVRRGKGKKNSEETGTDTVDFPKRNTPAQGYELLFQHELVQLYVSLVKLSHTEAVLEAAAGALQNLCAGNWTYGRCIRAAVRQEKGLSLLADHLNDKSERVVRAVCGALRNLCGDSRNKELIGKHALNSLVARLPNSSPQSPGLSEDTTVAIISVIQEVITGNLEAAKRLRESQGIERLVLINKGGGRSDREIRAAGFCLQTIWGYKDLRRPLEKEGWKKTDFLVTVAGTPRAQVYDDSTLPLIDRNQRNDKRSESVEVPLNDLRTDPYTHNGDSSTRHLNRSADLSELEPLKSETHA